MLGDEHARVIDHQVEDVVRIDEFLDELPLIGEVFFRRPGRAAKRALRAHALQTFLSGPKSFDWPRLRQHIAGLRLGWLRLLGGGRRLRSLREPRRLGHSHRFPVWLVGDEDRGAQPCPSSTAHRQPSPLMGGGVLLYRIQSWQDISALGRSVNMVIPFPGFLGKARYSRRSNDTLGPLRARRRHDRS